MSLLRDDAGGKSNLFSYVLDENELAACFYELYIKSAESMSTYGQDKHDKVKFAAYLYYLIKIKGFKGDNFSQSRFYQFIQEKVFYDLKQNVRTFNNRITELDLLTEATKHPMDYVKNRDFRYFQHLKSRFQESDYFISLKIFCDRVFNKT